ncbi:hypothetical protein AVEN_228596-1, partial [Araneus ventricosus]
MTSSKDVVFPRVVDSKVSTACKMPVQQYIDVITPFFQFIGDVSRNILLDFSSVTMGHIKPECTDESGSFIDAIVLDNDITPSAKETTFSVPDPTLLECPRNISEGMVSRSSISSRT